MGHKYNEIFQVYKENILRRLLEVSNYNHLILGWLYLNIPIVDSTCTRERFFEHIQFNNISLNESQIDLFFNNCERIWKNIDDPTLDNIRDACLKIVSNSIAGSNERFANSMIEIMLSLIKREKPFESFEIYNYLVKKFDKESYNDDENCRKMAKEFYLFTKRFLLLDYPLSIKSDLQSFILTSINEKWANLLNKYLTIIERQINTKLSIENEENNLQLSKNVHLDRCLRIFNKLNRYKNSRIDLIIQQTKANSLFLKLNAVLKLEMKLENTFHMFEHGNKVLQNNILSPAHNFVDWSQDKLSDMIKVFIKIYKDGLQWRSISELVRNKSLLFKTAAFTYTKDLLEIRVCKSEITNHITQFWCEIVQLIKEIRNLEREDVILLASVLYQQAINSFRVKNPKPSLENI